MTIFADASALIAIITQETDAGDLADCLQADPVRLCSALSVWETVAGLCRSYRLSVAAARANVSAFLAEGDIRYIGIGEHEACLATDAYARFGRGRHPASLNMGNCFAYACARANRAVLLFKGDNFTKTDIERA
jgi:ribonuclease VapC